MRLRTVALESFWVCLEGCVQCVGALLEQGLCLAVVDGDRCHVADARMAMTVVVPGEEVLSVGARVFDATETRWEVGMVFRRFNLRLAEWVVVADTGAAVGLGHL